MLVSEVVVPFRKVDGGHAIAQHIEPPHCPSSGQCQVGEKSWRVWGAVVAVLLR